MNKKIICIAIISMFLAVNIVCLSVNSKISNNLPITTNENEICPDKYIIGFKNNGYLESGIEKIQKNGGSILRSNKFLNFALVKSDDYQQLLDTSNIDDTIKFVEPNGYGSFYYDPNDPIYEDEQWGQKAIGCRFAWDIEKGDSDIVIAIVDSGVKYNHEDLTNYIPGGYDFFDNDDDPMDHFNHGTKVAGIAAATMDNVKGIAGVAQVKIIAERVGSKTEGVDIFAAASAIQHAADFGADIITLCWGSPAGGKCESEALEDACQYAWDKGVVLVGAAGNEEHNGISYPAAYDTVISVGAINETNKRDGSNWGEKLDLVAPSNSKTTAFFGKYENAYYTCAGTSCAAPFVAGVAALILSRNPSLSNSQVGDILKSTADDFGPKGWDEEYGYGRVNAFEAVLEAKTVSTSSPDKPIINGPTSGKVGLEYTYTTSASDPDGDNIYYWFDWGNGKTSDWIGPYSSGETVEASHIWIEKSDYNIKVKSRDIYGLESSWSEPLQVTMPKNKPTLNNFLADFFARFPILQRLLNL